MASMDVTPRRNADADDGLRLASPHPSVNDGPRDLGGLSTRGGRAPSCYIWRGTG